MTQETKDWLLDAEEPYIRFLAQRYIDPSNADRSLLDSDPFIWENLSIIEGWKAETLARHDKPDLFMHRLAMLADLGVTKETKGAGPIVESLLSNIETDGSFRLNIMIPTVFGGTGEVHADWVICDFPVIAYALSRMVPDDSRLEPAIEKLLQLKGESFYPCCGSIPKFKGPGPKNGMCPYANLLVARALSAHPAGRKSNAALVAAGAVLDHWTNRKTKKPFMFGMGTDFAKVKFPMVWYNILHAVSALKDIPGVAADPRFLEMKTLLASKIEDTGRVKPESIYMCYKTQEWSDKKNASRLLTILVRDACRE